VSSRGVHETEEENDQKKVHGRVQAGSRSPRGDAGRALRRGRSSKPWRGREPSPRLATPLFGHSSSGSPRARRDTRRGAQATAACERSIEAGARQLKKSHCLLREGQLVQPFEFIHAEKANHSIAMMCKVFDVSRSGYYAWTE